MTTQTPDAVREALEQRKAINTVLGRLLAPLVPDVVERIRIGNDACTAILAALDSRAGDAFDMPEYAPDDISHLEGLASYLDGVARDKGRAGLPASKSLFEEIAKRLREYDVIRNRGRAGDAGEGEVCPQCEGSGIGVVSDCCAVCDGNGKLPATPAPAVDAQCPSSPDGQHQVDTSMESGPNNCFHCEATMGGRNAR